MFISLFLELVNLNMNVASEKFLNKLNVEKNEEHDDDVDSMIELGQIAILSSSKASLKFKTPSSKEDFIASNKLLNESKGIAENVDDEKSESFELTLFQRLLKPFLPYAGIFIGILSAFSFCLSQIQLRRAKWFSATDHSIIRYFTAFSVMFIFLKYKEMTVFGPKKQLKLLLMRGFIGEFLTILNEYFFLSRLVNYSRHIQQSQPLGHRYSWEIL